MAAQDMDIPEQETQLQTLTDITPTDYKVIIGSNNQRVVFDDLNIPEDSCKIVKDILQAHPCRFMLTKSISVPSFYLHQFWLTAKVNADAESFLVTLDKQTHVVDLSVLREVLLLPIPDTDYAPMITEDEVLDYITELGYDQSDVILTSLSSFNVKYLSQPWKTFFMIVVRSISGRKSGHEHPRLEHLQVLWGMISMQPVDFARSIMNDMFFSIQSEKARTMIPFVRFTKLIVEHLLKNQPAYIKRLQ